MEEVLVDKELTILKKTVRSFVRDKVEKAELLEKEHITELTKDVADTLKETAQKTGLQAMGAKKEWGGAGLTLSCRTVLYEEAAQHRLGLFHPAADAFGEELPRFLEKCTEEQINTYVKPAIQQGKGCFVALWEELEDNDIEKLTCQAIKDGNSWIINGTKAYIEKFQEAGFGVILVNCLDESGEKQPTLFILEHNDSFENEQTVLIDVQKVNSLTFNDLKISDDRRVGNIGDGAELMKEWIAEAQVLLASRCLGVAVKALDYAKSYAKIRITRGQPLSDFPSIRTMIATGYVNVQASRLMVQDAAKKIDDRAKDAATAAGMAKIFTTDTASKIIDDCLQIHGGAGFAGDLPIERWYKELRIARMNLQKKETIIEHIANLKL